MLELRKYQEENIEFFKQHKRMYLYDDTGLGKTITIFSALNAVGIKHALILTARFLIPDIMEKNQTHYKDAIFVYEGDKKIRKHLWDNYTEEYGMYRHFLTNYSKIKELLENVARDKFFPWDAIVCDEIHLNESGLLNHKLLTKKRNPTNFACMRKLTKKAPYLILSTATPVRQGLGDYFAPLSLIDPVRFRGFWPFVHKYGIVSNGIYGKEISRRPANLNTFRELLSNYAIGHKEIEVLDQLPEVQRNAVSLEMNERQLSLYKEMDKEYWIDLEDDLVTAPNKISKLIHFKKILESPRLYGIDNNGTAVDYIVNTVTECSKDSYIAIFTCFRNSVEGLSKLLRSESFVVTCMGGDNVKEKAEKFNSYKGKKIWIGTIKSAVGYDLIGINKMFIIGAEESPTDNKQAEGRCGGLRRTRPITINYLLYKNTIHDELLTRLREKNGVIDWLTLPDNLFKERMDKIYKRSSKGK